MKNNDKRIKSAEPFCYLGEVMENRALKANVEIGQRQRFLLQAAALYKFVKNYEIKNDKHDLLEIVKAANERVQKSLANSMGRNIDGRSLKSEAYKSELQQIRDDAKSLLERMENGNENVDDTNTEEEIRRRKYIEQQEKVRELLEMISSRIKQLLSGIIQDCLEILGKAPCSYEVIVLGSLARGEMTPFSDLEWAILTSSEPNEEDKTFFRNLTNLVHLEVINLGETILPSMNIRVLMGGGWFYDDITPRGVSFDGLLPQACKTPLGNFLIGNGQRFELIHSPADMVAYQSDDWYKVNPALAEILLTVAPLSADNHRLVDEYVDLLREFLSKPCDLEDCHHHESSVDPCSIRKCRSTRSLGKDVTKYGEFSFASKQKFDGKLYDVKKDIYRLTDRVVAGLGSCFDIASNGAFAVLDELLKQQKISPAGRDNLASAVGIALKLRVDTYLRAGKQGEVMKNDASDGDETWDYRLPNEHELFHFFYVATPLYEKLYRFFNDGIVRQSLDVSEEEFFDKSETTKGDLFCRLSNYLKAFECYKRALKEDPRDVLLKVKLVRVELIEKKTLDIPQLDGLLRDLSQKYNPENTEENQEVSKLQYFGNDLNLMDVRLLVEMLSWLSLLYELIRNFGVAKNLLSQCMNAMEGKLGFHREGFGMLLAEAYFQRNCASLCSNSSDAIERSQLIVPRLESFIDREGASMRSLQILHELVEVLFNGGKYEEAYRWLQRGLSIGRDLYGRNANFKVPMTLIMLVKLCDKLNRCEERDRYSLMIKRYKLNN